MNKLRRKSHCIPGSTETLLLIVASTRLLNPVQENYLCNHFIEAKVHQHDYRTKRLSRLCPIGGKYQKDTGEVDGIYGTVKEIVKHFFPTKFGPLTSVPRSHPCST